MFKLKSMEQRRLTRITLKGSLADEFTPELYAVCCNTLDAVSAIDCNYPGFRTRLNELAQRGYQYRVTCGDGQSGYILKDPSNPTGGGCITIEPVLVGSGKFAQLVGGAVLLGVGIFTGGSTLIIAGALAAAGGVASLLMPTKSKDKDDPKKKNVIISGIRKASKTSIVPIVIGRNVTVAGVLVSGQIDVSTKVFDDEP